MDGIAAFRGLAGSLSYDTPLLYIDWEKNKVLWASSKRGECAEDVMKCSKSGP